MLPPAVRGLGSSSGFNFMIKDMNGLGHQALLQAKEKFLTEARKRPELTNLRMTNLEDASELRLDIDDRKAAALGLSYTDINSVLSSAMGGTYVNDFLNNERVKRVYIRAMRRTACCPRTSPNGRCATARARWCRSAPSPAAIGPTVRPSSCATTATRPTKWKAAPLGRQLGHGHADRRGHPAHAAGRHRLRVDGASLQERQSGAQAPLLYAISILFVFLCLAALYESWTVPLSVMLAVPLGVVGALAATYTRGLTNDVYFQVGLLTTVGLASKNAILIVEFAVQLQDRARASSTPWSRPCACACGPF